MNTQLRLALLGLLQVLEEAGIRCRFEAAGQCGDEDPCEMCLAWSCLRGGGR